MIDRSDLASIECVTATAGSQDASVRVGMEGNDLVMYSGVREDGALVVGATWTQSPPTSDIT